MPASRSYSVLLIFLLYLLHPFACYPQNRRIDSMKNDLEHPKDDTFRITLLYNLAEEYCGYDTLKGMKYLEQGHLLAEKMYYLYEMADYYEMKAKLFINAGRYIEAMPLLDTAI